MDIFGKMAFLKTKLLDMSCLLDIQDCQKHINSDNIDYCIKILEDEIKRYSDLPKGIRRKDLNLSSADLTANAPANAKRRYQRALERINQYHKEIRRAPLKYDKDDKNDMSKTLKIYFIIVEVELVNIRARIDICRSRLNMLNKVKDKL